MASRTILFLAPQERLDAFTATSALANLLAEEPEAMITIVGHEDSFSFYQDAPARLRFLAYNDLTKRRQQLHLAGQTLGRLYHRVVAFERTRLPYFLWARHRHIIDIVSHGYMMPHLFDETESGDDVACSPVLWSNDKRHLPLPENLADDTPLIVVAPHEAARAQWTGKLYAELAWRLSDTHPALGQAHIIVLAQSTTKDAAATAIVADIAANIPAGQRSILTDLAFAKQVALMQRARVFLGTDRLMARVAAAAGTPHIIRFDQAGEAADDPVGRPYSLYTGAQAVDLAAFLAAEIAKSATSAELSDSS
jgi:ADP-heptose:LPS heptosyltransferase